MEYRVENKYIVTEACLRYLQSRLEGFMEYDKFHPDGEPYQIRSAYFDDMFDSYITENEDGTDNRLKYRIRVYEQDFSEIHLECKSKNRGFVKKSKEVISEADCLRYIDGDDVWSDTGIKQRVYAMWQLNRLRPVQIVQYERVAMVEKVGHVRITFDRNIEGSSEVSRFFHNNIHGVPAFENGVHILEVKYDELLPDHIRRVLREVELRRTSYSKYYYTRRNQVLA